MLIPPKTAVKPAQFISCLIYYRQRARGYLRPVVQIYLSSERFRLLTIANPPAAEHGFFAGCLPGGATCSSLRYTARPAHASTAQPDGAGTRECPSCMFLRRSGECGVRVCATRCTFVRDGCLVRLSCTCRGGGAELAALCRLVRRALDAAVRRAEGPLLFASCNLPLSPSPAWPILCIFDLHRPKTRAVPWPRRSCCWCCLRA